MFKKIFILLFAVTVCAFSLEPFAVITIPKSGSHLLIKALYSMTEFTPYWHTDPPELEPLFHQSHFPYTHCCLSSSLLHYYDNHPIKYIVGIRDLRDVCVSIVYQIRKGIWPEFTYDPIKRAKFNRLTFDEQLLFVIQQEYELKPPEIQLQLGIKKVAEQALLLLHNPNALVCRYEDLVGRHGEGTEEAQQMLLKKISLHIGLSFNAEQIATLTSHLYGNEINPFGQGDFINYQSTFREGKIGSWKKIFKETHKIAFKKRLGSALIALGYEKDDMW